VTNPYMYQREKMCDAIRALRLPDVPFERRLLHAMVEFDAAFRASTPSGSALGHYDKIKQIMGVSGPWEERAKTLTEMQRHDVVKAFSELDRAVSHDYYAYEAHR
jgi:hypothetical protein